MNYSQKVLFDDWINKCPIEGVFVDEPVSQVKMDDGEFGYLIQVFLIINKEDWEQNQTNPGFSENSENFEKQQFKKVPSCSVKIYTFLKKKEAVFLLPI